MSVPYVDGSRILDTLEKMREMNQKGESYWAHIKLRNGAVLIGGVLVGPQGAKTLRIYPEGGRSHQDIIIDNILSVTIEPLESI